MRQVRLHQRPEHDHVVEAVDELGAEELLRLGLERLLDALVVLDLLPLLEPEVGASLDDVGADVRGHDDDGVAEVDPPAERVGQVAVVHHLQQHVEHVRVRLLDLVEEDDRVGAPAHALGELAALLVADVPGGRADQAGDVVLLHVLGHVEADHRLRVAEHELGQRLGEERLADAGRAQEHEAAHRALGVLQARARLADRAGHLLDRLVLADDRLVQLGLELQQPGALLLLQAGERHAGHLADDLGDDVLVDHGVDLVHAVAPGLLHALLLLAHLLGLVAQLGGLLVVGVLHRLVLLDGQALDAALHLGEVRRLGHAAQAQAGAGLVDHVDRLVRLHAAGDVPARQVDGGLQGLVGDPHLVVLLVPLAQALQDQEGLLAVRRLDRDRLEAPLERRVLLDVLAVLVEGGGAHALDLAAGEGGLEHVGRVDRALRAAGAHQGVQLVDEQDDVLGAAHLVHHRLDALLELAAVLRARHHAGEVEHHQALLVQQVRDLLRDDALRQALDDGRLADARLAQQHRVVLGAPAQDLDEALDLVLAPDDRVELGVLRELREVAPEAVERGGLALAAAGGGAALLRAGLLGLRLRGLLGRLVALLLRAGAEQVQDLLAHLLELQAEVHEHLGGDAVVLAQQAEQQVLGADVVVVEVARFLDRVLDDLLRARGLRQLAHGHHLGAALDELLHLEAHLAQVDVQVLQHVRADARAFLHQAEQDVLGPDVLVVEPLGLLVGQGHDLAGPIGESFEHAEPPWTNAVRVAGPSSRP